MKKMQTMKKIYIILLTMGLAVSGLAQVDRSRLPEPAPARELKIGDYETFELKNGLKVFVVENHKLPRVTFRLVLDRQPVKEGDKAGYLSMVGQMLRRGTTTRTKEQLDEEVDFIGAFLAASSASVYGSSLTKHKDKLLELMTDIMYNPTFPEEELEKIKKQTLSALAADKEDPESISDNVSTVLTYGKDHPYGELTTEETVENITVDDIKNYYNTYFKPNIAYLAIVGDIDKKEARKLVKTYFGNWQPGTVPAPQYEVPQPPEKTFVALVDKSSAVQSVINITYPVMLKPGEPDVVPTRVLNQILGGGSSGRLFTNLREDKGYTYGAYSRLSADRLVGEFSAFASVRNEVTDSALVQFMYELQRIKDEPVSDDELELAINAISGSFARSLERPQTVASFAINTARYHLPDDYYATYLQRVQAVSKADVQAVANKYIMPERANIVVVGKAADIADKLTPFGEVHYYDHYGNEYTPSATPAIPEGLTAAQVVSNYLQAVAGNHKLDELKDVVMESTASLQGKELHIKIANKMPDKSMMAISMGPMELQRSVANGSDYAEYQQGNRAPDNPNSKLDGPIRGMVLPEMAYLTKNLAMELKGIEKVDDQNAYVVQVVLPSGAKVLEYYDTDSGLKLRSVSFFKGPQGEIPMTFEYKDYREVDGFKLPFIMIWPLGPGINMEAKATSVKVNSGLADDLFKIE